jgi:serine/threonine protein kinase
MSIKTDESAKCEICGHLFNENVPAHHLLPGTILNGKFYVGEALGEGGFGITYIGRDINLDIKVAIKEYYPSGYVNRSNTLSSDVNNSVTEGRKNFFIKGRERFLNEARILAKFSGEAGIVGVRDFFEENNTAYIVMEFLDGITLKNFIKENGTLTAEQTVKLLMPVMISLKKVHSQNLIHRDISPDNIMIVGDQVKLLDFGAARNVAAAENKSLSVMLKPGYAPEEQYRSKGNQGPWTDIYALCATMYKCITGITPDDATQRVFSDEVKTPSALGLKITSDIEKAIMRGISVHQSDRFQSIDALIRGLQGIEVELAGSETATVAAVRLGSEDSIVTCYQEKEDELMTTYFEQEKEDRVINDDVRCNSDNTTLEPTKDLAGTSVKNIDNLKSNACSDTNKIEVSSNEDYSDIYSFYEGINEEKNAPNYYDFQQEDYNNSNVSDSPKKEYSLNEVIEEKKLNKKNTVKTNRTIAIVITVIVAIIVAMFVVTAVVDNSRKNKTDPSVYGFVFNDDETITLHDSELKNINPSEVYSSLEYNERMFYGSYTLQPDESSDDELKNYIESIGYSDIIYTEDGSYVSVLPYKIVAGPNSLYKDFKGKAEEQFHWMQLTYYTEEGELLIVTAAYEVRGNKLIITPAGNFEDLAISFYDSVEYVFEFSGPNLILTYNQANSVSLLADGLGQKVVGSSYFDYYNVFINSGLSAGSPSIDDIYYIQLSFNESNTGVTLQDSKQRKLEDAIVKMTLDGKFVFSYSDGHEKNTKYFSHEFVYFYCGADGMILSNGVDTYYYQEPQV